MPMATQKRSGEKINAMTKEEKQRVRSKAWYEKNKETVATYNKVYKKKNKALWLDLLKSWIDKLECQICGYNKCFDAMDLHHRDPITKIAANCFVHNHRCIPTPNRVTLVKAEVAKCDLLCATCHRELHSI